MNERKFHHTRHFRGGINLADFGPTPAPAPAAHDASKIKIIGEMFRKLLEITSQKHAVDFHFSIDLLSEDEQIAVYEAEIAARQAMIALHADDLAHRAADVDPLAEFLNAEAPETDEIDVTPLGGW